MRQGAPDRYRALVSKDGAKLQKVPKYFRADREIVLAAVSQKGLALEYAAKELARRKWCWWRCLKIAGRWDMPRRAARRPGSGAGGGARDGWALGYAGGAGGQEVVLAAVSQNGEALWYAAEELRADEEVVLAAVCSMALDCSMPRRSCVRTKVVLAAVSQDGSGLRYATKELFADGRW